jgi:hypothetical protein
MKMQHGIVRKLGVLFLGLFLAGTSALYAQEQQTVNESGLTTKWGIKGGLNLTNLYVANATTENMKVGFNGGMYVKIPFTRGFSLQPELLYSTKGAQDTYSNSLQGSGQYRFNLGYIEMPVLAVVNLAPNFNLHLGGYAAYMTNAEVKNVNDNGTIEGATSLNADNFNRWDFGLIGGLGFDIQNVTIGARYNYGLMNIGKSGSLSGDLTSNSKNAGFSFFVGVGF